MEACILSECPHTGERKKQWCFPQNSFLLCKSMNPVSIFFDLAGTTRDGHYCPHGSIYIYFSTHAGGVVVGKNLTEFGLASTHSWMLLWFSNGGVWFRGSEAHLGHIAIMGTWSNPCHGGRWGIETSCVQCKRPQMLWGVISSLWFWPEKC